MVACNVKNPKFDFDSRAFHFELVCKDGKRIEVSLTYNNAEELYRALKDMEMAMYVYKTGGFVDDY